MRMKKSFLILWLCLVTGVVSADVRDFWSAIKQADTFAVVKIEKYKSAIFQRLLPLPENYANEQVKISIWIQYYIPKSGQYLVPVIKNKGMYNIVGSGYQLTVYDPKTVDEFIKQWKEFKALEQSKETEFLKKIIVDNSSSREMIQSAVARLLANGCFKTKLSEADIVFWEGIIFDSKLSRRLASRLINILAEDNFAAAKPVLERALKDKRFTTMAASQFVRYDKEQFTKLMLEWLQDDQMRELALKNSSLLIEDKKFIDTAMKYFKNSDAGEVKAYLPILFAKDNFSGNDVIKDILNKQDNAYKKLIHRIYMNIIRSDNPVWTDEMGRLAQLKNSKGIYTRLKPLALAYLCRHKNKKGIELTRKYLESIKNDKIKSQRLLMGFSMVYRKKFESVEEAKNIVLTNEQ